MSLCKFPKQIQPVQTNPFKLCKIKRKKVYQWLPSHDFIYFNHCKKTSGRPQLDEFDKKSMYN
jgi:hypothetical protein